MSVPTPEQVAATLALSMAWRRALAEQEGPGWWCRIESDGRYCAKLYEGPTGWGSHYTVSQGWAWLPCCGLAWIRRLITHGRWWEAIGGGAPGAAEEWYVFETSSHTEPAASGRDPIDAAISFMQTHEFEEPTP